jgi:hypothetical protein
MRGFYGASFSTTYKTRHWQGSLEPAGEGGEVRKNHQTAFALPQKVGTRGSPRRSPSRAEAGAGFPAQARSASHKTAGDFPALRYNRRLRT